MNEAYISIGSNIDKRTNILAALRWVRKLCTVVDVSSVYETTPVGCRHKESFFNAAVVVQTPLLPGQLKRSVLNVIEFRLRRRRSGDKNAPRTIDLDISLFNDSVLIMGHRRIPDPEISRFVHIAIPLAEIAPYYIHPTTGEPLTVIATRLRQAGGIRVRKDIPLR
ncbi:MAG: 2-amino-4-hydroxy-6-hydroxymethyldihydropteridine diphosphokinase [Deltaproteobacteria bacterium]|nr:2-amino-4-hydroxy-6-hydroxymethyldihydropteridine diphosphokinase [Deltaproteobacteria bacterium]